MSDHGKLVDGTQQAISLSRVRDAMQSKAKTLPDLQAENQVLQAAVRQLGEALRNSGACVLAYLRKTGKIKRGAAKSLDETNAALALLPTEGEGEPNTATAGGEKNE